MLTVRTLVTGRTGTLPGLSAFCNAESYYRSTIEHERSWCVLTVPSEPSVICGLGVGLGVINVELPDGMGALTTRRFIAQDFRTAAGICSASSVDMIPWECKNSETLIRRLLLPFRFRHTSGSVSEHKGDVGSVTRPIVRLHLPCEWILLIGIPLFSIACGTFHSQISLYRRHATYLM